MSTYKAWRSYREDFKNLQNEHGVWLPGATEAILFVMESYGSFDGRKRCRTFMWLVEMAMEAIDTNPDQYSAKNLYSQYMDYITNTGMLNWIRLRGTTLKIMQKFSVVADTAS
jgi:hypothetical protein